MTLHTALPLATAWAEAHEATIVANGMPLTAHQAFDAHLASVKNPQRVRVMKVDFIPLPANPVLARANDELGLVSPLTAGITFGFGIYIREDLWDDRPLLVHELVHVSQYERYGSINAFLADYLNECLTIGYPNGPLEREAINRTREICT
jgi:hypothetical protein